MYINIDLVFTKPKLSRKILQILNSYRIKYLIIKIDNIIILSLKVNNLLNSLPNSLLTNPNFSNPKVSILHNIWSYGQYNCEGARPILSYYEPP